jgi:WD40 repeat protein
MSGSWDSSIRIWNVPEEKCIHFTDYHNADVYGISSHPKRPFLYISTSRDTTMRVWTNEKSV